METYMQRIYENEADIADNLQKQHAEDNETYNAFIWNDTVYEEEQRLLIIRINISQIIGERIQPQFKKSVQDHKKQLSVSRLFMVKMSDFYIFSIYFHPIETIFVEFYLNIIIVRNVLKLLINIRKEFGCG